MVIKNLDHAHFMAKHWLVLNDTDSKQHGRVAWLGSAVRADLGDG